MTNLDQIEILNDKIRVNNVQYILDRLNAKTSAFSEGNLDKHEFLTHKDLNYKPNALQKARFDYSPLGKAFNEGLNKKDKNYKEEGVLKLLKDIRDKISAPISGDKKNNDDNDDDDNDDNDKYLSKLDEFLKGLKDNNNFLEAVKDDGGEDINNESKDQDIQKSKELNRRLKELNYKRRLQELREYLREAENVDSQSRVKLLQKVLQTEDDDSQNTEETEDDDSQNMEETEDDDSQNITNELLESLQK